MHQLGKSLFLEATKYLVWLRTCVYLKKLSQFFSIQNLQFFRQEWPWSDGRVLHLRHGCTEKPRLIFWGVTRSKIAVMNGSNFNGHELRKPLQCNHFHTPIHKRDIYFYTRFSLKTITGHCHGITKRQRRYHEICKVSIVNEFSNFYNQLIECQRKRSRELFMIQFQPVIPLAVRANLLKALYTGCSNCIRRSWRKNGPPWARLAGRLFALLFRTKIPGNAFM